MFPEIETAATADRSPRISQISALAAPNELFYVTTHVASRFRLVMTLPLCESPQMSGSSWKSDDCCLRRTQLRMIAWHICWVPAQQCKGVRGSREAREGCRNYGRTRVRKSTVRLSIYHPRRETDGWRDGGTYTRRGRGGVRGG